MAKQPSSFPPRPTLGSPSRPPKWRFRIPSTRARVAVLGLGVSSPVIAEGHVLNGLSLPLMFAIVASMATVSGAASARALPRMCARVMGQRRDAALIRRLAVLCRMGDFPNRQERVCDLVAFLARKAGLSRREQKLLATASTLHRIGLVSLPPCPAGDHDGVVRRAATIAGRLLSGPTPLHHAATGMALSHEESWDGAGFPAGLAGQQIPFAARLLQVALALDALLPRTGDVPDRATLAMIAVRIQIEGGRTLDPALAELPCRHLPALECLLGSRLVEAGQPGRDGAQSARWSRMMRSVLPGPMLTPA